MIRPSSVYTRSVPSLAGGGGGLAAFVSDLDPCLGFGDFSFDRKVRMVSHVDVLLPLLGSPAGDDDLPFVLGGACCVGCGTVLLVLEGSSQGAVELLLVLDRKLSLGPLFGLS